MYKVPRFFKPPFASTRQALPRNAARYGGRRAFAFACVYGIGVLWISVIVNPPDARLTLPQYLGLFINPLALAGIVVVGGLPSTLLGVVSGWLIGLGLQRQSQPVPRSRLVWLALLVSLGSAAAVNGLFAAAMLYFARAYQTRFDAWGYVVMLGLPTLIYIGVVLWATLRFNRWQIDDDSAAASPTSID
jgi:hypothetical protein